jgi:hypothetical protein
VKKAFFNVSAVSEGVEVAVCTPPETADAHVNKTEKTIFH